MFADFDGAMCNASVYVNGVPVATYQGGYLPFRAELSGHLTSRDNVLAVVVDARWLNVPPDNPPAAPRPWTTCSRAASTGTSVVTLTMTGLEQVGLWSPDSPKLYTLRTTTLHPVPGSAAQPHVYDVTTGFREAVSPPTGST